MFMLWWLFHLGVTRVWFVSGSAVFVVLRESVPGCRFGSISVFDTGYQCVYDLEHFAFMFLSISPSFVDFWDIGEMSAFSSFSVFSRFWRICRISLKFAASLGLTICMRFVFLVFDFGFISEMIPRGKFPFDHLEFNYGNAIFIDFSWISCHVWLLGLRVKRWLHIWANGSMRFISLSLISST